MKEIHLTHGKVVLVDDEDFKKVVDAGPWHANRDKYGTWYALRVSSGLLLDRVARLKAQTVNGVERQTVVYAGV